MSKQLQRSNRVVNEQQTILDAFQIRTSAGMVHPSDCSDCATLKRVAYKSMSVDKLAAKSGAGVILLRERKKQFARAYRTRVDGIIIYLFVKYLGAYASRICAHQSCCLANLHVI